MPNYQTKRCIVCLKKATFWSGYVLEDESMLTITAGWCNLHAKDTSSPFLLNRKGCHGGYYFKYGKEET